MSIFSWMDLARKESLKSTYTHKIGAVIVSGGSVMSKAFNEVRPAREFNEFTRWQESLHAERSAIRGIKNKDQLVGATIYIYREHKNGQVALSMPCKYCFELIRSVGIKRIYFSTGKFPFYAEVRL